MLGRRSEGQQEFAVGGTLEDLIAPDYILRRVDRVLDLSWLDAELAHLYSPTTGRPSIAPETALRLMLAGFFHGIVKDRALLREASMHLGIRWFCGFSLGQALPDHSSLTRIRQRWGAELFEKLFARVVGQCIRAGLVTGETVHIDATLIAADCDWRKAARRHARQAMEENPLPAAKAPPPSDPDGALTRKATGERFFGFKQHGAVDSASGVVLDCQVTPASTNEGRQLPGQIERVTERLGRAPGAVTADAAYGHGANFDVLEQASIRPLIAVQSVASPSPFLPTSAFKYDARHDQVRCPAGQLLRRHSRTPTAWRYRSTAAQCRDCPLRERCLGPGKSARIVELVHHYPALLRARRAHARSPMTRSPEYRRHRWMIEGRHGEAKGLYHLGRAVRRGLANVAIQALLTACVMNLKRLARTAGAARALPPRLGTLLEQAVRLARALLRPAVAPPLQSASS